MKRIFIAFILLSLVLLSGCQQQTEYDSCRFDCLNTRCMNIEKYTDEWDNCRFDNINNSEYCFNECKGGSK